MLHEQCQPHVLQLLLVCMHAYLCVCMAASVGECACVCVRECLRVCVCVCVCDCIHAYIKEEGECGRCEDWRGNVGSVGV